MTKRFVLIAISTLLLCLCASAASAETCGKFKIIAKSKVTDVDPADFTALAEHFGIKKGFEWCWSQGVRGSLTGQWVLCGSTHKKLYLVDTFGFGYGPDLVGNPGMITTDDGDVIYTMSFSVFKWDLETEETIALGGVTRYMGDTGGFEGADGWTSDRPLENPPGLKVKGEGIMCLP